MSFDGQQPLMIVGATAGADLSASSCQYKFVKFATTTDSTVVLCAATTDIPCGVLQSPAPTSATGQPVSVLAIGQTKLQTDGTVNAGAIAGTNASGLATPVLSTMYPVARAVTTAAGSGNYIDALVNCVAPTVKA